MSNSNPREREKMTDEQRVKEPIDVPCPRCQAKAGQQCFEDQFGVYQHTFHNARIDAASRLPKEEPAPQTFEEWMLPAAQEINRTQLSRDHIIKDSFGLKHPIMSVDEQVAIMRKHWNAAKASSPAAIKQESSSLSMVETAQEFYDRKGWHCTRAYCWLEFAEAYAQYVIDTKASSPAVAGGESETEKFLKFACAKRCPQCKAGKPLVVNSAGFYSHSEEGNYCASHPLLKAYEDWSEQPLIKDVRGKE